MNRRKLLAFSAAAAFGSTLLPSLALGQTRTLKEQLIGTWITTRWEQVRGGETLRRFGDNPKGIHIFEANGHFALMYARPDLVKFAGPDPMKATPPEMKSVMQGSIAYYGTYSVDEATQVVELIVEASTFPNQVGTQQKRTITFVTPTELKYQNTTVTSGGQIYVSFKRAM